MQIQQGCPFTIISHCDFFVREIDWPYSSGVIWERIIKQMFLWNWRSEFCGRSLSGCSIDGRPVIVVKNGYFETFQCRLILLSGLQGGCKWGRQTRKAWEKYPNHDLMAWKCLLYYWPFVRGIHRWIPHKKGPVIQSFNALLSRMSCWTNSWNANDLRWHGSHAVVSPIYGHPPLLLSHVVMLLLEHNG